MTAAGPEATTVENSGAVDQGEMLRYWRAVQIPTSPAAVKRCPMRGPGGRKPLNLATLRGERGHSRYEDKGLILPRYGREVGRTRPHIYFMGIRHDH
ncbi:hypothetical protein NDU88_000892 [Pleurodeles waltl]|uniref:Uncharacterized protein n=1 Tax=Pleurodeles waltl TaxID=8319 RepID=A0AAV7Q5D1_PLEWA|nr:hypothetical protein NDU88_000892 [Pleurodeles waltl]